MKNEKKDRWDKVDIILKPVGGLLTAIAVSSLGFFGSQFLAHRQSIETNSRLYTELLSKREEAESELRKDMFKSIIDSFLKQGPASIEEKVLNLELLIYNFHESINLKPLFIHLKKELTEKVFEDETRMAYLERLNKVAKEITRKQMFVLEGAGDSFSRTIEFDRLQNEHVKLYPGNLKVNDIERIFRIIVLKADHDAKELKIRLEIITPDDPNRERDTDQKEDTYITCEFWVGFFDFPMIDNTRLSHDQRSAIVITNFTESTANVTLLEFPGSHASLKEKPYLQEVIENLNKTGKSLGESKMK
ncbi:MAG: hypothetical protein A2099_01310 [Planctomycetes bacterium GWF2_39_10]|nr:MAG: hypothetical protein A2099_01310 [Planctomycetes bacterium GWF2_39_10]